MRKWFNLIGAASAMILTHIIVSKLSYLFLPTNINCAWIVEAALLAASIASQHNVSGKSGNQTPQLSWWGSLKNNDPATFSKVNGMLNDLTIKNTGVPLEKQSEQYKQTMVKYLYDVYNYTSQHVDQFADQNNAGKIDPNKVQEAVSSNVNQAIQGTQEAAKWKDIQSRFSTAWKDMSPSAYNKSKWNDEKLATEFAARYASNPDTTPEGIAAQMAGSLDKEYAADYKAGIVDKEGNAVTPGTVTAADTSIRNFLSGKGVTMSDEAIKHYSDVAKETDTYTAIQQMQNDPNYTDQMQQSVQDILTQSRTDYSTAANKALADYGETIPELEKKYGATLSEQMQRGLPEMQRSLAETFVGGTGLKSGGFQQSLSEELANRQADLQSGISQYGLGLEQDYATKKLSLADSLAEMQRNDMLTQAQTQQTLSQVQSQANTNYYLQRLGYNQQLEAQRSANIQNLQSQALTQSYSSQQNALARQQEQSLFSQQVVYNKQLQKEAQQSARKSNIYSIAGTLAGYGIGKATGTNPYIWGGVLGGNQGMTQAGILSDYYKSNTAGINNATTK